MAKVEETGMDALQKQMQQLVRAFAAASNNRATSAKAGGALAVSTAECTTTVCHTLDLPASMTDAVFTIRQSFGYTRFGGDASTTKLYFLPNYRLPRMEKIGDQNTYEKFLTLVNSSRRADFILYVYDGPAVVSAKAAAAAAGVIVPPDRQSPNRPAFPALKISIADDRRSDIKTTPVLENPTSAPATPGAGAGADASDGDDNDGGGGTTPDSADWTAISPRLFEFNTRREMSTRVEARDGYRCVMTYNPDDNPNERPKAVVCHVLSASPTFRTFPAGTVLPRDAVQWVPAAYRKSAGSGGSSGDSKTETHALVYDWTIPLPGDGSPFNPQIGLLLDYRFRRLFVCGHAVVTDDQTIEFSDEFIKAIAANPRSIYSDSPALLSVHKRKLRLPTQPNDRRLWPSPLTFAVHRAFAPLFRQFQMLNIVCNPANAATTATATATAAAVALPV